MKYRPLAGNLVRPLSGNDRPPNRPGHGDQSFPGAQRDDPGTGRHHALAGYKGLKQQKNLIRNNSLRTFYPFLRTRFALYPCFFALFTLFFALASHSTPVSSHFWALSSHSLRTLLALPLHFTCTPFALYLHFPCTLFDTASAVLR